MSLSKLQVIGISHRTMQPWSERYVLLTEQVTDICKQLSASLDCMILATCHRTEFIFWGDGLSHILPIYSEHTSLASEKLMQQLHHYEADKAWEYLLQVCSGLDSMVIGETEVLGQFKKSYTRVREQLNGDFRWLLEKVMVAAKNVRTTCCLGAHPLSLPSIAVNLAEEVLGHMPDKRVVLIGSGQLAGQIVPVLLNRGIEQLTMMSRHVENARRFIDMGVKVAEMCHLEIQLRQADWLVVMVSSPTAVVGKGIIERVMRQRGDRPLLCLDLSMPRGIEPEVADITGACLRQLVDLESILKESWQARKSQAHQANELVSSLSSMILKQYLVYTAGGLIESFREYQNKAFNETLNNYLLQMSAENRDAAIAYHHKMKQCCLHMPTKWLRLLAESNQVQALDLLKEEMGYESENS